MDHLLDLESNDNFILSYVSYQKPHTKNISILPPRNQAILSSTNILNTSIKN